MAIHSKKTDDLLLVSQVFYPDEQATSQLLSELFAKLATSGRGIKILAGFPAGRKPTAGPAAFEKWRGICIQRGGWHIDGKRNHRARALAYGSFCFWFMWQLIFCTSDKARVLVVTNPPFAPVLVWLSASLRGRCYDVMLHDLYPDGLVAVGGLKDGSWITQAWRSLNRCALAKAERVFVLGRDMSKLVTERYTVLPSKIVYFPNWSPAEPGVRLTAESTHLWKRHQLMGKFVVQYSGNMGLWHDMDTIVRAAALLRDRPEFVFLFIGDGRRKADAEQLAKTLGLTNILWLPFQPQEELQDSLACCHAALISQRDGLEGVAVPSKLYGILASGRAVLAQVPAGSEAAMVVREEECGLVIQPGDAQELADAIKQLADNRSETDTMGGRAFAAYRAKYTLAAAVARFEQAMSTSSAS